MHRLFTAAFLALCLLAGCDSNGSGPDPDPDPDPTFPFNPDTLDFDTIASLDYGDYVQPLLAYRNVFSASGNTPEDRLASYRWDVLFEGADNAFSRTVIPFDAEESLLLKLVADLADEDEIPYPNLRQLEEDERDYLRRWIEDGARSDDGTVPFADAEAILYVCNQMAGRVAIIDPDRQQVIRYVYMADHGEPGGMMGALPHDVAAAPDGSAWFVTLIDGTDQGSVLKFSGSLMMDPSDAAYLLGSEVPLMGEGAFEKPGMVWFDAVNGNLAVGRSFSATGSQNVALFDAGAMTYRVLEAPNTAHPHAIAISSGGDYLLTASLANDPPSLTVYRIGDEGNDDELVNQLFVPGESLAFVQYGVSPDGRTIVLTSQTSAELFVLDLNPDTGELALVGRVPVGMQPWHPVFSPGGEMVYVPNRLSQSVSFVDVASRTVSQTVGNTEDGLIMFSEPHGSSLSANGRFLFVSNRNLGNNETPVRPAPYPFQNAEGEVRPDTDFGFVTVIDTGINQVVNVIPTGKWASGMAMYDPR